MKFFRKIYFAICDYIVCKIELSQLDLNIAKIKDCVTGKNGQVNEAYVLYAHLKHILDEDVSARNFMYASISNHGNFLSAARSKYEEVLMINSFALLGLIVVLSHRSDAVSKKAYEKFEQTLDLPDAFSWTTLYARFLCADVTDLSVIARRRKVLAALTKNLVDRKVFNADYTLPNRRIAA